MKKKLIFIMLAIAVIAAALSPLIIKPAKAQDLMTGIKPKVINYSTPDSSYIDLYNGFASNLLIKSSENEGNVLISPVSVYLALAMTANGADANTKAEMLYVLSNNSLSIDMLNIQSSNLIAKLNTKNEKTSLSIANSIWYDKQFIPYEPFLQSNADYYGAGLKKLDFSNSRAPKAINKWVSEATGGKIDKITEKISEDTVMYLINTIYFKSDWQNPFSVNNTKQMTFQSKGGEIKTEFLNKTGSMEYLSGFDAQGILIYYENKRFAYFAILPDDAISPRKWAENNGKDLFKNITYMISTKTNKQLKFAMPKFEVNYKDSIVNELKNLGLREAFDDKIADLSLMNSSREKNLYLSDIIHKTYFKVDEKGTEAAAATSVEVDITSMPIAEDELIFNRPFLYGIIDTELNSLIFSGIMENPS